MIRTAHAHLPVIARTHPGMKGKNNEDRFAVTAFQTGPHNRTPVLLAVLCDGIGGHRAGEVAAEMAVNRITQQAAESDGSHPLKVIAHAADLASREIRAHAQLDPSRHGMGATLACVWISGRRLFTATVGDSRIYLLRGGSIRQISVDHTWIQDALDIGLLKPDQVQGHPNAHVIRRYLGSEVPPAVDFRLRLNPQDGEAQAEANQGLPLLPGDRLLLCSDGLTDLVTADEILNAFQPPANGAPDRDALLSDTRPLRVNGAHKVDNGAAQPENVVDGLVDLANQRGGHDNITILTIEVPGQPAQPPARQRAIPWRWLGLGCAGLLALTMLLGGGLLGWKWYTARPSATPPLLLPATATPPAVPTLSTPTARPPTLQPAAPTVTIALLPVESGPTLTAWPTNLPSATLTASPMPSSTPSPSPTATETPTATP